VIRLNDELYWLYAAVDPETNELLHTSLEPTTNTVIDQTLWTDGNTNAYAYKRKGRNESGHIEEERLYVVDGKIRGERQTFDSMGASILTLTTSSGKGCSARRKRRANESVCTHTTDQRTHRRASAVGSRQTPRGWEQSRLTQMSITF